MLGTSLQHTVQKMLPPSSAAATKPDLFIPDSWPKQVIQLLSYPCNEACCSYARLWLVLSGDGAEAW